MIELLFNEVLPESSMLVDFYMEEYIARDINHLALVSDLMTL